MFVTGHTHAAYNCLIGGRRVTSAGSHGRLLTRIDLEVEPPYARRAATRADNRIVRHDGPGGRPTSRG